MAAINMEKEEVQPTYVLIYPYAYQSDKTKFIAKHGLLFFAVSYLICMFLVYLNTKDYFWVVYLPQFVFYSLAYTFGRNSDNETFQLTQILITYIFFYFDYYLSIFTQCNDFGYGMQLLTLAFVLVKYFYAPTLQFVHRKHYTRDLSTPQSVDKLNNIDCWHTTLLTTCVLVAVVLTQLLTTVFPVFVYYIPNPKNKVQAQLVDSIFRFFVASIGVISFCATIIIIAYQRVLYNRATKWNAAKKVALRRNVVFDSNGRAWYCISCGGHEVNSLVAKWKKLTCWNRSGVQPEEAQTLPLKLTADIDV